jgi:epoxide hydrolase-like predicted phosphatase
MNVHKKLKFAALVLCAQVHAEYKNIVFDIGGVILAGGPKYYIEQHAPHMSPLLKLPVWKEWDKGTVSKEELIEKLVDACKQGQVCPCKYMCKPSEVVDVINSTLDPARPRIDETVSIIRELKKQDYKLYVLSNFSHDAHDVFVKDNELFKLFDGMVFSCETGSLKPDAAIFNTLVNKYDLKPEETVFIDDQKENVAAASELGIAGVMYTNGTLVHNLSQLGVKVEGK